MSESDTASDEDLHKALEDFVLDSEVIRNLEAEFGGFNVFEAIGHTHAEERHSDFLSFLLDPQRPHGLEDEFLKRFVQEALKNAGRADRPLDLVEFSTMDLGGTSVLREHQNIDLLAVNSSGKFVLVIENKVRSTEHSSQLQKYRDYIEKKYPDHGRLFVYLTPDTLEPSDKSYIAVGYDVVADLVDEVLQTRASSMLPTFRVALEHYLQVLRRHIVSDPKLTQLAQAIYQKHKTALDFIFEQKMDLQSEIMPVLRKLVEEQTNIVSDRSTKAYLNFVPEEWEAIPELKQTPKTEWTRSGRSVMFEWQNHQNKVRLILVMGPTENSEIRDRIFSFCASQKSLFKGLTDKVYPKYMTLYSRPVLTLKKLEDGNLEEIRSEITEKWASFLSSDFQSIRDALISVFRR